jgi:hypothetical protein
MFLNHRPHNKFMNCCIHIQMFSNMICCKSVELCHHSYLIMKFKSQGTPHNRSNVFYNLCSALGDKTKCLLWPSIKARLIRCAEVDSQMRESKLIRARMTKSRRITQPTVRSCAFHMALAEQTEKCSLLAMKTPRTRNSIHSPHICCKSRVPETTGYWLRTHAGVSLY